MDQAATLLTIAEIAVALAGFASIVSVFGGRQDDRSRAANAKQLQAMLEIALRNAAFALLPLPFLAIAGADPTIWRVASGLYLATLIGYGIFRRIFRSELLGRRWMRLARWALLALTSLASLANVVGLAGENAFALYLASLLLGLVFAGLSFLSVAASVFDVEYR